MAQPDLQKFRQRVLALKLQTAFGVPAAPDTGADGVLLYDGSSGQDVDTNESNPDTPHFASKTVDISNPRAFVQGMFRLHPPLTPGHATDGTPEVHALLLPGGMTRVLDAGNKITRYNPITNGIPVSTAYWWHAGTHKRVTNARHGISSLALTIGAKPMGQVRVQGECADVLEEELPMVSVPADQSVVLQAANSRTLVSLLPGGAPLAVRGKSLSVDFGSDMKTKEYTQFKETSIDERSPTWTLRVSRTAKADFDPWAVRLAGTFLRISLRVKHADGRYVKLSIRGQIREISETDIDGDYGWELSGLCSASSAGGDEFGIEFGYVLNLSGTLADGTEGTPYTGSLTAAGDAAGALTWAIVAGTLPPGLTLNAATGAITGTPTDAGSYAFTVRVADACGDFASSAQTVEIAA